MDLLLDIGNYVMIVLVQPTSHLIRPYMTPDPWHSTNLKTFVANCCTCFLPPHFLK